MLEAVQSVLETHPWAGLLIVGLLAWLEYVFPPVPGDSTMLLAFFLAGAAGRSPVPVFACALGGSILGALTAYAAGRRLGRSYFFLRSAWARDELQRLERGFARFGARLLTLNRFLPGVRAFFLYAAGVGGLGPRPVFVYSTLSNILWVALIGWAGNRLGTSWVEVESVFRRYVLAIGGGAALYMAVTAWRARARRTPPEPRAGEPPRGPVS